MTFGQTMFGQTLLCEPMPVRVAPRMLRQPG